MGVPQTLNGHYLLKLLISQWHEQTTGENADVGKESNLKGVSITNLGPSIFLYVIVTLVFKNL